MRTDLTNNNPQRVTNEVLEVVNTSYRLFGICLKCKGVAKSAKQDIFYEVPKTYVVVTYFPFVNFFLSALTLVLSNCPITQTPSGPRSSAACQTCRSRTAACWGSASRT